MKNMQGEVPQIDSGATEIIGDASGDPERDQATEVDPRSRELGARVIHGIPYGAEPDERVFIPPERSEAMKAFIDRPA
jgi:hypothetical protein